MIKLVVFFLYLWFEQFEIMPTVLRIGQFRFHFYSDEYNEPPHIHVANSDGECKFWLEPVNWPAIKICHLT